MVVVIVVVVIVAVVIVVLVVDNYIAFINDQDHCRTAATIPP